MAKEYRYYTKDGKGLPSVTELLNYIPKPFLIRWANKLGLNRELYDNVNRWYTTIGTNVHTLSENYILTGDPKFNSLEYESNEIMIASFNGFNGVKKWYEDISVYYKITPIFTEKELIGDDHGGTADFCFKKDNVTVLADFKTSRKISLEYIIQLATYARLCITKYDIPINKIAVIRVNRDKVLYEYAEYDISDMNEFLDVVDNIIQLHESLLIANDKYKVMKKLNKSIKG